MVRAGGNGSGNFILVMEHNTQKHSWQECASMLFGQSNNVAKTEEIQTETVAKEGKEDASPRLCGYFYG